ncbi:MAG: tRNA lysidine(34) synthetase TilS [Bacteroidota bacterium]
MLFNKNDFLLVAVSGGVDSVVLTDLLHQAGHSFAIAHCNFSLRGKESDDDEAFVVNLSKKYQCLCFTIRFDTMAYAQRHSLSIQMAARELRYQWLNEILKMYQMKYLLTAHHLNDNVENILLHQIKGTGIKGLTGIPIKQNNIVRPLLPFTKDEILQYAREHQLSYRDDSSNTSDKYQRNYIRLNVIPHLQQLQPQLLKVFEKNIQHFSEAKNFIDTATQNTLKEVIQTNKDIIKLNRFQLADSIISHPQGHFILFEYLSQFDFNDSQIKDILRHLSDNKVGLHFHSKTYNLYFDRNDILILPCKSEIFHTEYIAHNIDELNLYNNKYSFEIIVNSSDVNLKEKNIYYINADALAFPLKIRKWKNGDKFMLFGTNYLKKLSDIFVDKKVPLYLKNKIDLFCNDNGDIFWISDLGLIHQKYKVESNTKRILKIVVNE